MLTITDNTTHVTITHDNGQIFMFPKNKYEISQDVTDLNHFIISESDRIEYDFYWADVSSPASANPQALMTILSGYFFDASDSSAVVTAVEGTTAAVEALTKPLNSSISKTDESLLTRGIDYEEALSQGLFTNSTLVLKSGRNPNITSASVPEDVISGSTPYAGFPTSSPEELQFLSDNAADTGTVTFVYLPTSTSTAYQTATITLNGTTPVNSGITAYRVHTMFYNAGSGSAFNQGIITCRWRTTTTVIFLTMAVGTSQSYSAVYTVPFGSTAYIKRVFCEVHDASSISVQGALWTRLAGASPRLRRNFACQTGSSYIDVIYGGLILPSQTDITLRITQCTSNSATTVVGGFDLILVAN